MNTEVNYLGLKLKNPIIVGSSSLTNSVEKNIEICKAGAGAIVLKSIFEEQILINTSKIQDANINDYPEAHDYLASVNKDREIDNYINLISETKKNVDIPVIASVNCKNTGEWISLVKEIEDAGADAIEINISLLPVNFENTSSINEEKYIEILKNVRANTKLPIALKMSKYAAGLANLVQKISYTGYVDAFVLFNKYYSPDIDINNLRITQANISSRIDSENPLRWLAIFTAEIENTQFGASSNVRSYQDIIKQILAGATSVQAVSLFYEQGIEIIPELIKQLENWMTEKNFNSIEDFRGKMNYKNAEHAIAYKRTQFMNY